MFNRFNTKLDRAVLLSIVAMVAFNLAVLINQQGPAPQVALSHSAGQQG